MAYEAWDPVLQEEEVSGGGIEAAGGEDKDAVWDVEKVEVVAGVVEEG